MKQLLISSAIARVLRPVRTVRDRFYFVTTRPRAFDPTNLGHVDDKELAALFRDQTLSESWTADHRAITSLFPDGNVPGGLNPGERRALYFLLRALKPARVLEIGTHIGASTIHMARALSANGGDARLTTVDLVDVNDPLDGPWKRAGLPMPPRALAEQLGCADVVEFVATRSLDFLRQASDRYDFVFLDGDHRPHAVYLEISAALQVLAPRGLVVLHDYYPGRRPLFPDGHVIPGPAQALERIRRENVRIAARPLGVLPWPTKQGVNVTSLALLTRTT